MGRAKEIVMRVIPTKVATPFMKAHHYSGKVVNNSTLHFGVFLDGNLHGVMSYGPSLDKSKIIGLVKDTGWNEFLELNRMAFDSYLPRNSESRAISMSLRLIKKYAPQIKWVISFADACSCGDGTIYRASNFVLTGIKENLNLAELPDGTRVHKMTLASNPTSPRKELGGLTFFDVTGGTYNFKKYLDYVGATPIPGFPKSTSWALECIRVRKSPLPSGTARLRRRDDLRPLCAGRLTADRPPTGGKRRFNSVLRAPKITPLLFGGIQSNLSSHSESEGF